MNDGQEVAEARELTERERKIAHVNSLSLLARATCANVRSVSIPSDSWPENIFAYLRSAKPDERSELARRYVVSITELEKVFAISRFT